MIYFALFFIYFLGNGAYFSGFSPYVLGKYSHNSASIFLASQLASPAGTLLAGYLTDRTRALRIPLVVSLGLLALGQFMFFSDLSPEWTLLGSIGVRLFLSGAGQILIIATLENGSGNFARARTAGTIGFCVVQIGLYFVSEWITVQRDAGVFGRWTAVFYAAAALLALWTPRNRKTHEPYFFKEALSRIVTAKALPFFAVSFLFYLCYQLVDFYIGRFLELRQGISSVYLGWGLSVFLEILIMPFTAAIFERMHARFLFVFAILAGGVRFAWLGFAAMTPEGGASAVYAQIFHGIHFAGYYAGVIYLMRRYFPPHLFGTGHALFSVFAASAGGIAGNLGTALLLGNAPGLDSFARVFFSAAAIHAFMALFVFLIRLPARSSNVA